VNGGVPVVLDLWQTDCLAARLGQLSMRGVISVYALWQERAHGTAVLLIGTHLIVLRAGRIRPSLEPLPALLMMGALNQLLNPNPGTRRKVVLAACALQGAAAVLLYPVLSDGTRALTRWTTLLYTTGMASVWAWSAKGSTGGDHAAVPGTAGITMLAAMAGRLWAHTGSAERVGFAVAASSVAYTAMRAHPGEHALRRVVGDLGWPAAVLASAIRYGDNVTRQNEGRARIAEQSLADATIAGEADALAFAYEKAVQLVALADARLRASSADERLVMEHLHRLEDARRQLAALRLVQRQHANRRDRREVS
jgi:hypothetical protein